MNLQPLCPATKPRRGNVSSLSVAVIRYIAKCALGRSLFGLMIPEGEESITARGTVAGAGRSHLSHMQEAEGGTESRRAATLYNLRGSHQQHTSSCKPVLPKPQSSTGEQLFEDLRLWRTLISQTATGNKLETFQRRSPSSTTLNMEKLRTRGTTERP